MKVQVLCMGMLMLVSTFVFGQDEGYWEPQKQVTGYLATEGNYFFNLEGYDREYGVSLSEAGLLFSYKPLKSLTIKSVVVYRPDFSLDQVINEANAEWKFSDALNLKVGRFLTPLSPMNTYYYAPVNRSITLPMLISHHVYFPLNMEAISINGKIGNDFKVDYDFFSGGLRNSLWLSTGPVGIFGEENAYFLGLTFPGPNPLKEFNYNSELNYGSGGHIGFAYKDYVKFGVNGITTDETIMPNDTMKLAVDKVSYGLNFELQYSSVKLVGEVWRAEVDMMGFIGEYQSSFYELSYGLGKFIPYVRYEDQDNAGIAYSRYTGGLNFKPNYEVTLKLEYLHYEHEVQDLDGIVGTLIYSF